MMRKLEDVLTLNDLFPHPEDKFGDFKDPNRIWIAEILRDSLGNTLPRDAELGTAEQISTIMHYFYSVLGDLRLATQVGSDVTEYGYGLHRVLVDLSEQFEQFLHGGVEDYEGWLETIYCYMHPDKNRYDVWKLKSPRVPLSPSLRFNILKRDDYRCQICGADQSDGVKLEIDHKVPVTKGGTNDPDNLQVLCFDCNRGKGVQDL